MKFSGTDETRAEIEGWNALASRIETANGGQVDRAQLLERASPVSHFVSMDKDGNLAPAPGVKLDGGPYLTYLAQDEVSTNARAISAVFYTPELQARYATHAIEVAASTSRQFQEKTGQSPYETRLNLDGIGQTAESLEAAGLDLDGNPFTITDTSRGGLNWIQLKHTRNKQEAEPEPQARAFAPDQPGFRYYEQALEAIRNSPNIPAGTFTNEQEERLAGSMAKAALSSTPPLRQIDSVVASKINPDTGKPDNIFAVQGGLHDPTHLRAHLPLDAALSAPIEQTSQQVNQLAQVRQQEQQQQDMQQQQQAQQRVPVLS